MCHTHQNLTGKLILIVATFLLNNFFFFSADISLSGPQNEVLPILSGHR